MKELNKKELSKIEGGINVTGTVINAFTSGVKIILEIGRSLGTALRRGSTSNLCEIK